MRAHTHTHTLFGKRAEKPEAQNKANIISKNIRIYF